MIVMQNRLLLLLAIRLCAIAYELTRTTKPIALKKCPSYCDV